LADELLRIEVEFRNGLSKTKVPLWQSQVTRQFRFGLSTTGVRDQSPRQPRPEERLMRLSVLKNMGLPLRLKERAQ
jgi:hypothetical protein